MTNTQGNLLARCIQLQFANVDSVSKTLKRVRFYTLSINQNIDDADR